jgi:hypothetical protein
MSNFSPYSNYGYAALVRETTKGVVSNVPNNFFRIVSESISASYANQEINEVAGDRERRIRSIQGQIEVGGDIVIFMEEKFIGHFLTSLFGIPTSQTVIASTSYRHVFEVTDTPVTYTIDLKRADAPWVHRYVGVHISSIEITRSDNGIQATISCMPIKAFQDALVTESVNSGTTLKIDQTSGLHVDDTVMVLRKEDGYTPVKELAITTIDGELQLTTATIDTQIDAGDIVVIKAQATATYTQCDPFQFMNGTAFYTGTDIDNTSEFTIEDFTLTIANEFESKYGSGINEINRYPFDVLTMGYTAEGSFTKFYDSEFFMSKARSGEKFPLRALFSGREAISANSATKASSIWGTNGFKIESATAGKAGNDISVTIVINDTDDLDVSKSGNNILIELANTTASKNTGTLIATAVDALTGIDSTAQGTGAEQFTSAETSVNLGFKSTGTNVVGADASQKPYLQIDFSHTVLGEFAPNNEENNIIPQEVPFLVYKDEQCNDEQKKVWSTRISLFNSISSY